MRPPVPMAEMLAAALANKTVRFFITGGSAAALFYGLTFMMVRAGVPPFSGTLTAFWIVFLCSYTVQHAWTFSGQHEHRQSFPRYFAAQIVCAFASAGIARACGLAGLPPATLALAPTLAASALSYMLSRYWVFADRS